METSNGPWEAEIAVVEGCVPCGSNSRQGSQIGGKQVDSGVASRARNFETRPGQ